MEPVEMSNEFDILFNNIMSNQAPGINEYEKSVFLTKAMLELLKNYYNPKGNKYQEGFDDSSPRQYDFSNLMVVIKPELYYNEEYEPFDERSYLYKVPNDILAIVDEKCFTTNDCKSIRANIVPINYNEYNRLITRPYAQPLKRQVWRMINSFTHFDNETREVQTDLIYELIGKQGCEISDYRIRYIRKPKPIITCDLDINFPGCSIDGEYLMTPCELDSAIHPEIVQRAVEIAKASYISGLTETSVQMGQRSE